MSEEQVELCVELLMKADGSDSAWQMQRLCQGLNVSPAGVCETFFVKTGRENANRLLSRTEEEWSEWCKSMRNGAYAFQVLDATVTEMGNEPAEISASEMYGVLIGEIERKHTAEDDLCRTKIQAGALLKMLAEANQALRSAYSIAERDGKDTWWSNWRENLKKILEEQHRVLWPERYKGKPELDPEGGPSDDQNPVDPEQEPSPACETCGGSGKVTQTDYEYVDRFTKWERKTPIMYSIECPACHGNGKPVE